MLQKISIPPTEGTFVLDPQPPGFSIQGDARHIPPPPGISVIFQPGWVPPGKNTFVKMPLHYTFMRKIICDKEREKIFLLMLIQCQIISILPSRGLS